MNNLLLQRAYYKFKNLVRVDSYYGTNRGKFEIVSLQSFGRYICYCKTRKLVNVNIFQRMFTHTKHVGVRSNIFQYYYTVGSWPADVDKQIWSSGECWTTRLNCIILSSNAARGVVDFCKPGVESHSAFERFANSSLLSDALMNRDIFLKNYLHYLEVNEKTIVFDSLKNGSLKYFQKLVLLKLSAVHLRIIDV